MQPLPRPRPSHLIAKAYLALERHQHGRVGSADAELLDAADLVRYGAEWMERHFN